MWIGVQPQLQVFVALFGFPNCGKGQKETLLRRETIDFFLRFSGERFLEGGLSQLHPANVRNIFPLS